MDGRGDDVGHELGSGAHELRVVIGPWIVGAQDEPLEMVDVRIEPDRPSPDEHVACRGRVQRSVEQQTAQAIGAGRGHVPDEAALVADDRRGQPELAREAHGARHHPARDERDRDASIERRADRGLRSRPDDEVLADERPVDVEGNEADRVLPARASG